MHLDYYNFVLFLSLSKILNIEAYIQITFANLTRFITSLSDSKQIRLTLLFSLVHNLGNILFISTLRSAAYLLTQTSAHTYQIMTGSWPALEKGPLTALLGGSELMAQLETQPPSAVWGASPGCWPSCLSGDVL